MAYAPRQRQYKERWKIILPILVLICLLIYMMVGYFFPEEVKEEQRFTVCGLSEEKTLEVLSKSYKDTIEVKDYFYYGESLNLYQDTYSVEKTDTLSGKTIELRNVCTDETISMTMENTIDQKLVLDEIPEGFYEVFIMDNLVKKRVVFDRVLDENEFFTAKRNNKVNRISLIADNNLLHEYGKVLDQNYLFLDIQQQAPSDDEIDVLIDPYGMNTDLTWLPDEGAKVNGLVENDEMYYAATLMKKELEQNYGLRVEITKQSKDEEGKAYGEDGRLAQGYKKHAKYYLFLRFNNAIDDSYRGFEIMHSAYVSRTLARNITYDLEKNLNLDLSEVYLSRDPGIVTCLFAEGLDGKLIYDSNLYLRESGGRGTMAARYSENSQTENKSFKNENGMLGLEIDFAYISNKEDAKQWKKSKDKIIIETARAFAEGINASHTTK